MRLVDDAFMLRDAGCSVADGLRYAVIDALYVFRRGLPVADADAHRSAASPGRSGKEGFAGLENLRDDEVGEGVVILLRSRPAGMKKT